MVRGLLFDFDGLLLDTEGAALGSWQDVYADYGVEMPVALWVERVIGRAAGAESFDPVEHLEQVTGRRLDRDAVLARRALRKTARLPTSLAPGVESYLADASSRALATAIVTSEYRDRVLAHLDRIGAEHVWDAMICADGDPTRGKPNPTLYLEALDALSLDSSEVIAFEDSPNGVRAAKAAGITCVVVPNAVTRGAAGLEAGDLLLTSLEQMPLNDLLAALGR